MASVSRTSGSSISSLYGTRNVISGLASGLDTESMIENAVSAFKTKISTLNQKRTKVEWQQESYRSIITKMASFTSKYADYMSANNLMSASFFNTAVKTVAQGKNADKISATGRASSNIQINRVRQLAKAASYTMSGSALDKTTSTFNDKTVTATASGKMKLDGTTEVSNLNGSLTLAYGGSNARSYLTVNFDETKIYEDDKGADGKSAAQKLADDINKQLSEQSVSIGSKIYTGQDLLKNVIRAEVSEDGKSITFTDPKENNVFVSSASGSAKDLLLGGKEPSSETGEQIRGLSLKTGEDGKVTGAGGALGVQNMEISKYLKERNASIEITLDGKTKTIQLPDADAASGSDRDEAFVQALQKNINDAFGEGKLTVRNANKDGAGIKLQFETAQNGSTVSVNSTYGKVLGFGEGKKVTSYLNTSRTLGELLAGKDGKDGKIDWSQFEVANAKDADGKDTGEPAKDDNGKTLYSFRVNGKEIGQFNEDSTLSDVFNAMNSNSDSEVKVGYSRLTNEIAFTAKDTGEDSKIDFSQQPKEAKGTSLSEALFGKVDVGSKDYTAGQDAIFEASVNGTTMELRRSSNTVDLDGMSVTLKGTFGYDYTQQYGLEINGQKFTASGSDNRLKIASSSGSAVKYSTTNTSLADFNGKEVYGQYADGKMRFFVDDGKGNTKELYARTGSNGGVWFSINQGGETDNATVGVTKGETLATKTDTEAVSFQTSSDADKIVDVVKQMVEDYNAMAREIKSAYSTLPVQRANGKYYEPLTEEDEADMSESAVNSWNEKAKTGILFGDSDLSNLYSRMTSAVSMTGEYGSVLRSAGITVSYSNGLTTLEFNETKFREALDRDPDKVRDAFTASTENGAKQNGLMQSLKEPLDMYGKTTGGKGILVEKAGHPLAASTMFNNTVQRQLDDIDQEIEKWQDRMSDKVDYYTNQFSRLEQLIAQMNSQTSMLSGLMGGY